MEDVADLELRPKSESKLLSFVGAILGLFGNTKFMTEMWTTKNGIVWYPSDVKDPRDPAYHGILLHEKDHVKRQLEWREKSPFSDRVDDALWLVGYLIFPVPFFFAWYRWKVERCGYLVQLKEAGFHNTPLPVQKEMVNNVVQVLWKQYAWPWPRKWMRIWFLQQLAT